MIWNQNISWQGKTYVLEKVLLMAFLRRFTAIKLKMCISMQFCTQSTDRSIYIIVITFFFKELGQILNLKYIEINNIGVISILHEDW